MARWAVLGGIMLVVAGCGMGGGDKPRIPCPNFLLLGHAENMTRFQAGPGRDITDIDFRAAITNFHGTCSQDADEVEAEFFIEFAIQRGPANRSRQAKFEYFVAIPRFHPAPAGKKTFSGAVTFGENQTRVFYRDQITLTIPLKPSETGASYDVYLGFQLDAEQLQYNMRRKAR